MVSYEPCLLKFEDIHFTFQCLDKGGESVIRKDQRWAYRAAHGLKGGAHLQRASRPTVMKDLMKHAHYQQLSPPRQLLMLELLTWVQNNEQRGPFSTQAASSRKRPLQSTRVVDESDIDESDVFSAETF
jgi:hypothetical protein